MTNVQPSLVSEYYLQLLRIKHREFPGWGRGSSGKNFRTTMSLALADCIDSVLDYGCGKGQLVKDLRATKQFVRVDGYDPGVRKYETLSPAQRAEEYDLVVCFDVLEHVEPLYLAGVIEELTGLGRAVYAEISLRPAFHLLPNGQNAHLIVQPASWWMEQLPASAVVLKEREHLLEVMWSSTNGQKGNE